MGKWRRKTQAGRTSQNSKPGPMPSWSMADICEAKKEPQPQALECVSGVRGAWEDCAASSALRARLRSGRAVRTLGLKPQPGLEKRERREPRDWCVASTSCGLDGLQQPALPASAPPRPGPPSLFCRSVPSWPISMPLANLHRVLCLPSPRPLWLSSLLVAHLKDRRLSGGAGSPVAPLWMHGRPA